MEFIPIAKPDIGEEEIQAVEKVLRSGMLVQGAVVKEFEEAFSRYLGVEHSVAVSNGTVALDLALKALDLEPGSEVICPGFTFIATANAILYQGLRPVFADVDTRTFNLDPSEVQERITSRTGALIGVHLYGQPFEVQALQQICQDHDLALVEDCAQAHGAEYDGRKVGTFGTGCFSFYPTKNMTTGEGGMITTDDPDLASRLRLLRNHGDAGKYDHQLVGYNYRMTNIQGAIGLPQLSRLESFVSRRIANATYLSENLSVPGLAVPYLSSGVRHVFNQYVLKVQDPFPMSRDSLASYLQEKGIGTGIHYPRPIYRQAAYAKLGLDGAYCPGAEEVSSQVLSLPIHPSLELRHLDHIVETLRGI